MDVDIPRIAHPDHLYFQRGYGTDYGFEDGVYEEAGANVVSEREVDSLEVLCIPKFCERDIKHIRPNRILFGWLHLLERSREARELSKKGITAIAWECMKSEGEFIFYRNGVLTGEIGVLHGIGYAGKMPEECNVAVIGKGRVGTGAIGQLRKLGVINITIYDRRNSSRLRSEIGKYDYQQWI